VRSGGGCKPNHGVPAMAWLSSPSRGRRRAAALLLALLQASAALPRGARALDLGLKAPSRGT
jgi:hypothetical protein